MRIRNLLIAAVIPGVLIAGPLAGSALAHVEVDAPGATEGGSGTVTFTAESEETTPLTKIEIAFPAEPVLLKVSVPAKDGWTSAVTQATSAAGEATVSRITWTATAGGVAPGKTGEFPIEVGQFPAAPEVVFKSLVTYADGTVVSWIELQAAGGPEPEHPAPVLKLAPAAAGSATSAAPAPAGAATVAITSAPAPAPAPAAPADTAEAGPTGVAGTVGTLVLAILVTVGAVVASRRRHSVR